MTQTNLSTKNTHRHREQTSGYQGGGGMGEGRTGSSDQQTPTVIYRMNKQGLTAQHMELHSMSCRNSIMTSRNGKEYKEVHMCN